MDKIEFIEKIKECRSLNEAVLKFFNKKDRRYNKKILQMCEYFNYSWNEHLNNFKVIKTCQFCGNKLTKRDQKKFCNSSCSASFNNVKRGKKVIKDTNKQTFKINIENKKYYCVECGKEILNVNRNKTNKYCSIECANIFKHKEKYSKILNGDESIMRANYMPFYFKKDILFEQDNKCDICGCEPFHNGKPLVFVLDHIDGNAANNERQNLRCVCPNCDSQLDTFKSKNKNGARHYYRYHKDK